MKRLFRNKIISHGLCFVLGAIIFGSIGVVATNYLLKAEDVEYRDNKNLQDAIDELYGMANSPRGAAMFKLQANGTPTSTANTITVNFTKVEPTTPTIVCRAKDAGGNIVGTGTVTDNTCNITGLQPETPYTYEIIRTDQNGVTDTLTGTKSTTQVGGTMQTTNLVSSTGVQQQGLLGIVYLDPTNLSTSCNASNSVSTTGTKTGCMKWYAYKLQNGNYTMILDHNTTATIAYNSSNSNTSPTTIQPEINALTSTSGWVVTPRLISADEIAGIVGNTSWNSTSSTKWFYFDSKNQTQTATSQGASAYAWLFDYTNGCTSYGCNTADSSTYGYWTSSKYSRDSSIVWTVAYYGDLDYSNADFTFYGLRPVIEVLSSILSIS